MGWLQFIAEMTKNLSWPVVAGMALYIFKDDIKLDRFNYFKHKDVEGSFPNTDQATVASFSENQNLDHLILSDMTDAARVQIEEMISSQLTLGASKSDKIDFLIKKLAQEQISKEFEKIYYRIYGSQIRILEFLSVQDKGRAEASHIYPIYQHAKKQYAASYQDRSFIDYMNYLVVCRLVTNEDDSWALTRVGRVFLSYITAAQLDKNKPL